MKGASQGDELAARSLETTRAPSYGIPLIWKALRIVVGTKSSAWNGRCSECHFS